MQCINLTQERLQQAILNTYNIYNHSVSQTKLEQDDQGLTVHKKKLGDKIEIVNISICKHSKIDIFKFKLLFLKKLTLSFSESEATH